MVERSLVLAALTVLGAFIAGCPSTDYDFSTLGGEEPVAKGTTLRFDFTNAAPGKGLPPELVRVLGDWEVRSDGNARHLAQVGAYHTPDFPRVFVKDKIFTNVHVKVRCAMIGGSTDRGCGIIWRAQDSDNYFIARANALEDNVNL